MLCMAKHSYCGCAFSSKFWPVGQIVPILYYVYILLYYAALLLFRQHQRDITRAIFCHMSCMIPTYIGHDCFRDSHGRLTNW